jgi:hypothetical protein
MSGDQVAISRGSVAVVTVHGEAGKSKVSCWGQSHTFHPDGISIIKLAYNCLLAFDRQLYIVGRHICSCLLHDCWQQEWNKIHILNFVLVIAVRSMCQVVGGETKYR